MVIYKYKCLFTSTVLIYNYICKFSITIVYLQLQVLIYNYKGKLQMLIYNYKCKFTKTNVNSQLKVFIYNYKSKLQMLIYDYKGKLQMLIYNYKCKLPITKVERASLNRSQGCPGWDGLHPCWNRLRGEPLAAGHVPVVSLRPRGHQVPHPIFGSEYFSKQNF